MLPLMHAISYRAAKEYTKSKILKKFLDKFKVYQGEEETICYIVNGNDYWQV